MTTVHITQRDIEEWGRKFFPHLLPKYQVLAVLEVLFARAKQP